MNKNLIKRLLSFRFKLLVEFKWEVINILWGDTIELLFLFIFWYSLLSKGFFGIPIKYGFLYISYQALVQLFWVLGQGFRDYFLESIKDGSYLRYLLFPKNSLLIFSFINSYFPLGPTIQMISFFLLSIYFGLKIDIYIILGYFISIISGFLVMSLLFLTGMFSFNIQSESQRFIDRISRRATLIPTYFYKGWLFILSNIILPSFAYGTYSFLISIRNINFLILYYSIYTIVMTPLFFFLGIKIYNKKNKKLGWI